MSRHTHAAAPCLPVRKFHLEQQCLEPGLVREGPPRGIDGGPSPIALLLARRLGAGPRSRRDALCLALGLYFALGLYLDVGLALRSSLRLGFRFHRGPYGGPR